MAPSMRSSNCPCRADEGQALPVLILTPAPRPISMMRACLLPMANTRLVAVFFKAQPSKAASAAFNSSRGLGRCCRHARRLPGLHRTQGQRIDRTGMAAAHFVAVPVAPPGRPEQPRWCRVTLRLCGGADAATGPTSRSAPPQSPHQPRNPAGIAGRRRIQQAQSWFDPTTGLCCLNSLVEDRPHWTGRQPRQDWISRAGKKGTNGRWAG